MRVLEGVSGCRFMAGANVTLNLTTNRAKAYELTSHEQGGGAQTTKFLEPLASH